MALVKHYLAMWSRYRTSVGVIIDPVTSPSRLKCMRRVGAITSASVLRARKMSAAGLVRDREDHMWCIAKSSSDSARHGDAKACYSAVRALSGAKRPAEASIKWLDGSLATSSQSRDLRWQEQFASVFSGEIVECPGETAGAGRDVGFVSSESARSEMAKASVSTPSMLKSTKLVDGSWQFCRIVSFVQRKRLSTVL